MNCWWFCEVQRSSGYTTQLSKANRTRTFWICMVGLWDYFYRLYKHRNILHGGSVFSWSEPASECDTEWRGEFWQQCSIFFSSRYLALQFLANTVTTAEHLWWMENRRLDFSFASSLFFREFGNNVCNANKDTSKNGLLAFSMVEMFYCVKISMIGFWSYFFIALPE